MEGGGGPWQRKARNTEAGRSIKKGIQTNSELMWMWGLDCLHVENGSDGIGFKFCCRWEWSYQNPIALVVKVDSEERCREANNVGEDKTAV